ncbi:MAG: hypothetical protein HY911_10085 [Desulfobacterales bacterium]|nr:hypothetical protein [Desulfobacterales bacterium]
MMNNHRTSGWLYKLWRAVVWVLVFFVVLYVVPTAKNAIFPDLITRMEKMMQRSNFTNCSVDVFRQDEASLLLKVTSEAKSPIATEMCKYFWKELVHSDQERVFFNHAINRHPDGSWYLNQTQVWADVDLKRVRRLEVQYCDQMVGDDGQVSYKEHRPIFKCAVAVEEATCLAAPGPTD